MFWSLPPLRPSVPLSLPPSLFGYSSGLLFCPGSMGHPVFHSPVSLQLFIPSLSPALAGSLCLPHWVPPKRCVFHFFPVNGFRLSSVILDAAKLSAPKLNYIINLFPSV
ncbi:unnamed protein product [Arctogadus glacialis]